MTEIPLWLELLEKFFIIFTASLVAFGILSVELDGLHLVLSALRRRLRGEEGRHPATSPRREDHQFPQDGAVPRFDLHARAQHFLLMASFLVLAITGLAQKFYQYPPAAGFLQLLGGWESVRWIHRIAAFAMMFSCLYHGFYLTRGLLMGQAGRWQEMLPTKQDLVDFFHMVGYYLGFRSQSPQFGRYSYMQKFDYWAVFWGIAIMGGSGFIMMFPQLFEGFGGTAVIAASLTAHSDEAVLAVSWIAIVHLYHAHLNPRIFPFNPTMFTGKIPLYLLREEHSREYARLVKEGLIAAQNKPTLIPRQVPRGGSPEADLTGDEPAPGLALAVEPLQDRPSAPGGQNRPEAAA